MGRLEDIGAASSGVLAAPGSVNSSIWGSVYLAAVCSRVGPNTAGNCYQHTVATTVQCSIQHKLFVVSNDLIKNTVTRETLN